MNGYGAYSGRYTLHFDYELERGDETWEVEVIYETDGDDLQIEDVRHNGYSVETTDAEDIAIIKYARERVSEDIMDAEAAYGDYRYDTRED